MKIDVRKIITEYDGSEVTETQFDKETDKVIKTPITLRKILATIVTSQTNNEPTTAEDLSLRNQLAIKIFGSNEPDFTPTERNLIFERLPKVYPSPRIFGIVKDVLYPEDKK